MRPALSLSHMIALLCGGFSILAPTEASAMPVTPQALAAQKAEGPANSAIYNAPLGMSPGEENRPVGVWNRDLNGNTPIVTGTHQSGVGAAGAPTVVDSTLDVQLAIEGTENTLRSNRQRSGGPGRKVLNGKLKF